MIWLSTKQLDREEYKKVKRTKRKTLSVAKREMWDKKYQELNISIGEGNAQKHGNTNNVKATEMKQTNVELINIEKWEKVL